MVSAARIFLKIKYITLVNLILDEPAVQELIQDECNTNTLTHELDLLLNNDSYIVMMMQKYQKLRSLMGHPGASAQAASLIIEYTANEKTPA